MSGLSRYAGILHLFTEQDRAWTVPAIAARLAIPASTVYRTVRELSAEGFLEQSGEARYRLGAAFVAFDRLTRMSDPLVQAGAPVLRDLVRQAGLSCVGLLCRLYDDTVMCVADAVHGAPAFHSSYERGRRMPLTDGATSKVILAQLPARRLTRLLGDAQAPDDALRATLAAMRRRGYTVSRGEIDRGLVGIAAPIASDAAASLSLVVEAATLDPGVEQRLTLLVVSSAALVTGALLP